MIEITQALIWACVYLLPPIIYGLNTHDFMGVWWTFKIILLMSLPIFATYFLNYSLLIPRLLFRRKTAAFILYNTLLMVGNLFWLFCRNSWINVIPEQMPGKVSITMITAGFTGVIILMLILQFMTTMLAIGMRYVIKWNEDNQRIEEERRRNAEAELSWLKNQLNPHFLFNTMNNISSLTQIDPDKAQESIGQLSELLRYALYESNVRKVRLEDEIEFMKNYISLMSLRCNSSTLVEASFEENCSNIMISPLLFISLIENAFKHGTSGHRDSLIKIDMRTTGNNLVFSCKNTFSEKKTADHSGSGIGLENMKRRLEFLYPESYSYKCSIENDIYTAQVRIDNIKSHE